MELIPLVPGTSTTRLIAKSAARSAHSKGLWRELLLPDVKIQMSPSCSRSLWRKHLIRRKIAVSTNRLSFIIFRLDSLGDVVMTTPLFRALKTRLSRLTLHRRGAAGLRSLLATNPHIDEILTLPNIRPAWLAHPLQAIACCLPVLLAAPAQAAFRFRHLPALGC